MIKSYGTVYENALIRDYTTYKLEGKIKKVISPDNLEDLVNLLTHLKKNKVKNQVIGNGSNLIFLKNYDGIIIKLDKFNDLEIDDNIITVGAGYSLIKLALKTAKLGLSGLEFASGIPGTIGGAIYMNAGAYKKSMSDIVTEILVIDDNLKLKTINAKDLRFKYRHSLLKEKNYICLSATMKLEKEKPEKILAIIKDRKERRKQTQPLNYPSAGSVFRNPKDDFAGRLIEELGLKGYKIGDAMISKKHANFIVNTNKAKGKDVKKLIELVQKEAKEKYNIDLILEQEYVE